MSKLNKINVNGTAYDIEDSEAAKKDGHYSTLGAGTADQLNSPDGTTDNSKFNRRTTAGNESVTSGNVKIKSIKGNTVAWNQIVNSRTNTGWTGTGCSGVYDSQNNEYAVTVSGGSGTVKQYKFGNATVGHKYYISAYLKSAQDVAGVGLQIFGTGGTASFSAVDAGGNSYITSTSYVFVSGIGTVLEGATGIGVRPRNSTATGDVVYEKDMMCIDLTLMFGAGNEPATVADFKALFPLNYYAYDAGSLKSIKPSGMETVGLNQWDEQWELGGISASTGANETDNTRIRSKNYIPVFPNTAYYIKSNKDVGIRFYDANKNYIGNADKDGLGSGKNVVRTMPANAFFVKIVVVDTTTYNHDICINLSHSGLHNGEYHPYEKRTLAIDTLTYFPNGMRGAGSAYDEFDLVRRKARPVIDTIDLGTLNYTKNTVLSGVDRYFVNFPNVKKGTEETAWNILCAKFETKKISEANAGLLTNVICGYGLTAQPQIWIYTAQGAYADAEAFKTAMSGVIMQFEKATVTEVDIPDSVSNIYFADDWGTEEWLQDVSMTIPVPVSATLFYMRNLVDEIRNVRKNCLETGDSLDNLLTVLGSACNGTFAKSWDDTNNEWTFTFTANGGD